MSPPYPRVPLRGGRGEVQFSPRIGISYPITDRGAVHISYGHFFQIPPFEFLYKNPNFRIPLTGNYPEFVGNTIGNADLQPQRTTMYEIGLQQELTPDDRFDGDRILQGHPEPARASRSTSRTISRSTGSTSTATTAPCRGSPSRSRSGCRTDSAATIDYTYQVAKGNASDPNDDFNKAQAAPPIEVNKALVPLDWDRRHSLNVTLTVGTPDDFIASVIGRFGSGLPYTPSLQNQRTGLENSDNRPSFYNVDLYCTKYFTSWRRPTCRCF